MERNFVIRINTVTDEFPAQRASDAEMFPSASIKPSCICNVADRACFFSQQTNMFANVTVIFYEKII